MSEIEQLFNAVARSCRVPQHTLGAFFMSRNVQGRTVVVMLEGEHEGKVFVSSESKPTLTQRPMPANTISSRLWRRVRMMAATMVEAW